MRSRNTVAVASLLVGMALASGLWFGVSRLRKDERRQVWMDYVRGPLPLYVQGSRQGAELLKFKKLKPLQRMRLGDAVQGVNEAWSQAVLHRPDYQADAFFSDLDATVQWFGTASQLADSWPRINLKNSDIMRNARGAAFGIRANIRLRVEEQWKRVQEEVELAPDELKESKAAVAALEEPLPQ